MTGSQVQDGPEPLNPVLAEKLQKYGLAKCVYAAAHDIEPWTVDETDGGYGDVCELNAEDWNATLEPLALALGMPDDSNYAEILQRVADLAARPAVPSDVRERIMLALHSQTGLSLPITADEIVKAVSRG